MSEQQPDRRLWERATPCADGHNYRVAVAPPIPSHGGAFPIAVRVCARCGVSAMYELGAPFTYWQDMPEKEA